ncbi:MAG: class I SAM-dependent methyltransferase [Pseudomonadales bacterium]
MLAGPIDIPSPIDFQLMRDARDWESKAMDRPFRLRMFEQFSECIAASSATQLLDLGSGPGFLAKHLCNRNSDIFITLLDYSKVMHELSRNRLAGHLDRVKFVTRDFKKPDWTSDLGKFDCIVTNQAVHELRHKCHAATFHEQAGRILNDGGIYLVCDHFFGKGGMSNNQLYMSVQEQLQSLNQADFEAELLLQKGSFAFIRAFQRSRSK